MVWNGPRRSRAEQRGPPLGQGVFLVVGFPKRAIKHIFLSWTGDNSCCAVHASRSAGSEWLTSRTRLGRRPPRAARQDQPEWRSAKRVQADPRTFLDRQVNAAACQIHVSNNWNLFKLLSHCPFAIATHLLPTNGLAGFAGERSGGTQRCPRSRRRECNPTCLYSCYVHEFRIEYCSPPKLY